MRWSRTARYDPLSLRKTGRASDLAQGTPGTFRDARLGAFPGLQAAYAGDSDTPMQAEA